MNLENVTYRSGSLIRFAIGDLSSEHYGIRYDIEKYLEDNGYEQEDGYVPAGGIEYMDIELEVDMDSDESRIVYYFDEYETIAYYSGLHPLTIIAKSFINKFLADIPDYNMLSSEGLDYNELEAVREFNAKYMPWVPEILSLETNAMCPHCGKLLRTFDYYESTYPLVCPECYEDMYFIENKHYSKRSPNPVFKVCLPMSKCNFYIDSEIKEQIVEIAAVTGLIKTNQEMNIEKDKVLFYNYSNLIRNTEGFQHFVTAVQALIVDN